MPEMEKKMPRHQVSGSLRPHIANARVEGWTWAAVLDGLIINEMLFSN